MEHLNLMWFSEINAGANLHGYQLWLSILAAKYLIFIIVLWLLGVWVRGTAKQRNTLILAFGASLIALFINWGISLVWFHPRPFVLGVGHTYLIHAPDSSFPSDHFTALCTIFFVFWWQETIRHVMVFFLMLTALIVAWARIYVGVHYPFDMLGGVIVSAISTAITIYLSPLIERYLVPISEYVYQKLLVNYFQGIGK